MKKGFTLLELLVVVLIISILVAIAWPQYTKSLDKAAMTQILTDIDGIEKSIDMFYLSNGGVVDISGPDLLSALDISLANFTRCQNYAYGGTNCYRDLANGFEIVWEFEGGNTALGRYYARMVLPPYSPLLIVVLMRTDSGWSNICYSWNSVIGKNFCSMVADRPGWEIQ